jgi:3-phenylpropionate/trans-cinnamate dioxygenase ferredoxin component
VAKFIVAPTSAVTPGQMKTFTINGQQILIANWQGTFFATQDLCTHDGGTLADGELIDGQIECPRHGARFDPQTGAVTALPAMFPIKTFPLRIEGTSLTIELD